MVGDMLLLQLNVHLPALPQSFAGRVQVVYAGSQLTRNPRQQSEALTVEVLLSQRAGVLAAVLGGPGAGVAIGDICKGWSRGWTMSKDEFGGRLVILSEVDDHGCGGWFGFGPLW